MRLDHDSEAALDATVDLVNSDDHRTGVDHLRTVDDLAAFLDLHQVSGTRAGNDAELRAVRRLRPGCARCSTRRRPTTGPRWWPSSTS